VLFMTVNSCSNALETMSVGCL